MEREQAGAGASSSNSRARVGTGGGTGCSSARAGTHTPDCHSGSGEAVACSATRRSGHTAVDPVAGGPAPPPPTTQRLQSPPRRRQRAPAPRLRVAMHTAAAAARQLLQSLASLLLSLLLPLLLPLLRILAMRTGAWAEPSRRRPDRSPPPPPSLPTKAAAAAVALVWLLAAAQSPHPAAAARARAAAPPPPPLSFGMATLQARYPNHSWSTPVVVTVTPRGPTRTSRPPIPFIQVRNHSDQAPLYDENLELDLAPWRRRAAAAAAAGEAGAGGSGGAKGAAGGGGGLRVSALVEWALTRLPFKASQRLVVIRGGRVGLIDHPGRLGNTRQGADTEDSQQEAEAVAAAAAGGAGASLGGGGLRVEVLGECPKPCDPILADLLEDLRAWVSASPADWPDALFLLNTADTSLCAQPPQQQQQQQQEGAAEQEGQSGGGGGEEAGGGKRGGRGKGKAKHGPCPAPVLSSIKEWGKYKDEDVLVPITVGMHRWRPLAYFPWRSKLDVAAWRGREYCHTRPTGYTGDTCSRTYLAGLSAFSEEWGRLVDVGFVDNYTARGAEGQPLVIPARGFVPTQELARFRYVLALDGITASSRLARLLSLNSVVVKQTSPWIEWYYRSLVPGTHYVTFWNHHRTDLLNTLRYIRHKSRYLLDVSVHGQAFAYRYLTPTARRLYWQRAVSGYVGLFGDMESYMAGLVWPS
ncbi:hypothetical protein CHLRE_03g203793v5 [Chlamydomonas reinhardtii]|uniref:Glycosyl transferase CAP10 domain-containing protein n=1 Tax=Chlamydomonas reinhardtii TaxID=3055 RepID=A0A2K3DZN4_CHLRE|nr:uncharacterized protein CHLRE_03g203793v5 [Chlamydomonas reinhardtii]PNW86000.1 hypothetical protein CHLRE_03g203793v5 [Chlamydomonas reinhardtii]